MSTKNLARTILEAGRGASSGWGRREDNRVERAQTRQALARVRDERADADDVLLPVMKKTNRFPGDKLGAPERWLASHVGRPWNVVYSELCARFDTRTLAGHHIIRDHLVPWVAERPRLGGCWQSQRFVVDRHGILRRVPGVAKHPR